MKILPFSSKSTKILHRSNTALYMKTWDNNSQYKLIQIRLAAIKLLMVFAPAAFGNYPAAVTADRKN